MTTTARLLNILIRVFAAGALILGLAFWLGYARSFTLLHVAFGTGFVISLWVLAGFVWKNADRKGLVALAVAWGLVTWVFGFTHGRILPGPSHWAVAVTHLVVAMIAVAVGGQLTNALANRRTAPGLDTERPAR